MTYITIREAAEKWDLTPRRVQQLCKNGEIEGAVKEGRSWLIREDISYQVKRLHTAPGEAGRKRPLPVGVSSYKEAVTNYYYVDKTLMIRDFLDRIPKVTLFTRPRRFGKTLNMDMLRVFFEKTEEDTSLYFKDKAIWTCGEAYRRHLGRYPVIFLSFKDVKFNDWQASYQKLAELMGAEYERHAELAQSDKCTVSEKAFYQKVVDLKAREHELAGGLLTLSAMLHKHHGTAPIIMIDEYDTPIQQGYRSGFYGESIAFMRNLFSACLKDNEHLSFGFLTGILRVAKESIFSGMNNLVVDSVLSRRFDGCFGFTREEIRAMAAYYQAEEKLEEIMAWYDGYRFGEREIFNPWSVVNYFYEDCRPQAYWVSSASNEMIGDMLQEAGEQIRENLRKLLQGGSVLARVDTDVIYPEVRRNPDSIYSFLLMTGYLKIAETVPQEDGSFMGRLEIPNKEISFVYAREIMRKLMPEETQPTAVKIGRAIFEKSAEGIRAGIEEYLQQTVSFFDTGSEAFYQGLMLGLCAMLNHRYQVRSNREAGLGRFDIALIPLNRDLPGFIFELKQAVGGKKDLKKLAEAALQQIQDKAYAADMKKAGVREVILLGIAFQGKKIEIVQG